MGFILIILVLFRCSEAAVIGDTGAGDNNANSGGCSRASPPRHHHGVGDIMNIFTIIGVVVVVILVAGYFGVHGLSF